MNNITEKINRGLEQKIRSIFGAKEKYFYKSYWHSRHYKSQGDNCSDIKQMDLRNIYLAPGMNYGAGIAHQMSCWLAGYTIAKCYNINFAHRYFFINGRHAEDDDYEECIYLGVFKVRKPTKTWDQLLGLGEGEVSLDELIEQGYKRVRLPYIRFNCESDVALFNQIVTSYKKAVFVLAIDNVGYSETGESVFHDKFQSAKSRVDDETVYNKEKYNIAIHIRRGDVDTSMPERFCNEAFFVNALRGIVASLDKPIKDKVEVYIFSEGDNNFVEFQEIMEDGYYAGRIHFCLNWSAKKTFIHMVYADELVISPSGFSANAALVGNAKRYKKEKYKYMQDVHTWINLDDEGNIIKDR